MTHKSLRMENALLKRRAVREAMRFPEPRNKVKEGPATNRTDIIKDTEGTTQADPSNTAGPMAQNNAKELEQPPSTLNNYVLKTPPLQASQLGGDNTMEEDKGVKWDGVLREKNLEEGDEKEGITPTVNKVSSKAL